jgi:hypothetical protein
MKGIFPAQFFWSIKFCVQSVFHPLPKILPLKFFLFHLVFWPLYQFELKRLTFLFHSAKQNQGLPEPDPAPKKSPGGFGSGR